MPPMDITFKCRRFTITLYLAPTISPNGKIAVWKGRHSGWKRGFVVRVLWLGFLVRWDRVQPFIPSLYSPLEWALRIQGDYPLDFLEPEGPH